MPNWTISYTDVFGKKKVESFKSHDEAQARYEDLLPRTYGDLGDLEKVTAPMKSAVKVTESLRDDLKEQFDDLEDVARRLMLNGEDNAAGRYFYVKPYPSNSAYLSMYSIFSKTGSHVMDILVGGETVDIINGGDYTDEGFDAAYDVVEPIVADMFRLAYSDGNTGIVRKFDNSADYHKAMKEDCGGSSAASLGAVPTAVVRPSHKQEALPPKKWGITRRFPSRAALVNKAKSLRGTEITDFDEYLKLNKDLTLDKIGFAMDRNGNSVARLWWGEGDEKYYYSTSRDVLDRTV